MTREQEHAIRQQARQAANHDDDLGRERSKARAEWWVGYLSHELGIVDNHGMIDVGGEVARAFVRAYMSRKREVWPTPDTSGTSEARKRKAPEQEHSFAGYDFTTGPAGTTVHRQHIDTSAPGDHGSDPLGDGTFRMVPSGDIVDYDEMKRRLARFAPKGMREAGHIVAGRKTKSADSIRFPDGTTMTLGEAFDAGLVVPIESSYYDPPRYFARAKDGDVSWEIGKTLYLSRTGGALPFKGGAREASRIVADFNTLDDLISHAARDLGATHVAGTEASTKIYFPRGGQFPYEEATVWRKNGYWHAQGPGARTGVERLPAGAKPIAARGAGQRRAAETRRSSPPIAQIVIRRFGNGLATADAYDSAGHLRSGISSPTDLNYVEKKMATGRRWARKIFGATHVEDYAAVDHRDRVIAGPFKHYSDAQSAAGPAGHVKFVPAGRGASEAHRGAPEETMQSLAWEADDLVKQLGSPPNAVGFLRRVRDSEFYRPAPVGSPNDHPSRAELKGWIARWKGELRVKHGSPRVREAGRHEQVGDHENDESRGEAYADEQLASPYFMDWSWGQMVEGAKLPPDQRLTDMRQIAKNMLQDVEYDTRRDLSETREFFEGFRRRLKAKETIDWLAEELGEMQAQIGGTSAVAESGAQEGWRPKWWPGSRPTLDDISEANINSFAQKVADKSIKSRVTIDEAFDSTPAPKWAQKFEADGGSKMDLDLLVINRAKSFARRAQKRGSPAQRAERKGRRGPKARKPAKRKKRR